MIEQVDIVEIEPGVADCAGFTWESADILTVDIVEIEPGVAEMARVCAPLNHNVLQHPKVRILYNDARELLLTSPSRYDVIFSEPSDPYRAGVASLFTAEIYRTVSDRMNPGAVFAQWLQAYEVDSPTVSVALATLRAVFGQWRFEKP